MLGLSFDWQSWGPGISNQPADSRWELSGKEISPSENFGKSRLGCRRKLGYGE